MTPAAKLFQAIELAKEAANALRAIGVGPDALQDLDLAIDDLTQADAELPHQIHCSMLDHCEHCPHAYAEPDLAWYGCKMDAPTDCPVVQVSGYTDPGSPPDHTKLRIVK